MNVARHRPLSLAGLRTFEAVARQLSFRAAAEELHLTQPAVSRQIQALEDELGARLFDRGTRHVALTGAGSALLRVVAPWLDRLDAGVRQIRQARGRRVVQLSTFPSFASLWLLPAMEAFQRDNPDLDIRVSAIERLVDLDEPDLDLVLRYCSTQAAPPGAQRLFGELTSPVIGARLADRIARGDAPPLATPADLAQHTLAEEDDHRPSAEYLSWRYWLAAHGLPGLEPRRWIYLNFTYQQVQAALAGQGIALARVALVADALARGELVEPFGTAGRVASPFAYWLIASPGSRARDEVDEFCRWVESRAALTRGALGEPEPGPATPPRAR